MRKTHHPHPRSHEPLPLHPHAYGKQFLADNNNPPDHPPQARGAGAGPRGGTIHAATKSRRQTRSADVDHPRGRGKQESGPPATGPWTDPSPHTGNNGAHGGSASSPQNCPPQAQGTGGDRLGADQHLGTIPGYGGGRASTLRPTAAGRVHPHECREREPNRTNPRRRSGHPLASGEQITGGNLYVLNRTRGCGEQLASRARGADDERQPRQPSLGAIPAGAGSRATKAQVAGLGLRSRADDGNRTRAMSRS